MHSVFLLLVFERLVQEGVSLYYVHFWAFVLLQNLMFKFLRACFLLISSIFTHLKHFLSEEVRATFVVVVLGELGLLAEVLFLLEDNGALALLAGDAYHGRIGQEPIVLVHGVAEAGGVHGLGLSHVVSLGVYWAEQV